MSELAPGRPGWRVWVEAARPRTLPASIVPVLVGTAASEVVTVRWGHFALAMIVALALQVAVNFANDWFDGVSGVDTAARVGPRRVTASGMVTPAQIKVATFAALGVAAVGGLALALLTQPWLLLVGLAAGAAALGYSGGPKPYASAGLGEVFVFIFFGLVATMGSQYVQDETFSLLGLLAACAVGLWSVALLLVNNLRDIPTDAAVGKRTLAVRIGEPATRNAYVAAILMTFVLVLAMLPIAGTGWVALPLLALALVGPAVRIVAKAPLGPVLIEALQGTAKAQLAFGVLLTVGLALRSTAAQGMMELTR
ncbi:MAG: 1,4-dihydroxy-2-naphthoate octaprenyltransferase [Glaciecola sp.]|jgi:1,4-dihydroxy-2-naphthoate octaprenyltransferase